MQVSRFLRNTILIELFVPILLLTVGIYHGLMQVIYRAGVIHQSSVAKLDYYQGLTLHGVINAVVLTTFFAVAFGHATIAFYLKKEPNKKATALSMWLMVIGTLLAAAAMLAGKASVLYTFYPPLKAHPAFYIGTAMLIIGSWVAFFDWVTIYLKWKKENPETNTPLAIIGTLVNFTIWFVCTTAVAYEVLVLLVPWSLGHTPTVNVPLARTLFWFFGHALVYFWLLPSYIMFYTMLPKLAGGKLYSATAGRIAFFIFLLLSIPIGVHHQFGDPSIGRGVKLSQSLLTFGVALPSFITAFTLAASLEYAARKRGATGLYNWIWKLPFFRKDVFLFGYLINGLILFIFGGLTGLVLASYSLNNVVHNTAFIPGHFHMTVAGPVFLAILGMSIFLLQQLTGKKIFLPTINAIVPYLWTVGVIIFSSGLMWGGLMGEPRRTNLGLTYLNPASDQYHPYWVISSMLGLAGGGIMFVAGFLYFISFFGTLFSKRSTEPLLDLPESEPLHEEKRIPVLDTFKPWLAIMALIIFLTYLPAISDALNNTGKKAPPYLPTDPTPVVQKK
ncbi:cbb3-type cytochrome c oxidase subunit I [Chitinophaga sp. sic0106]|uniref:cbb3-type cytochrome c oxidase subunit I n=1 Tax=Chitinophaga sp. sic0106 TaxID=2854785 RepID=UPI001C44DA9B|nr:cbb3-type cytochrome c oxidase subunit I [Chitinophaga sp. sic0106]MBV7530453.1 cbb3-type cytochrome c oxidase subunit I [Chitinophaga sp. sic0106]